MKEKLFGTDGIRGTSNTWPIVPELIVKIGKALAQILKQKTKKRHPLVIIGKDTRICGYIIEMALTSGLCSSGANVQLIGPLPTPGIAYLVKSLVADLGVVLTASHNPYYDNGIKFFSHKGTKIDAEFEREIESLVLKMSEEKSIQERLETKLIGKAFRLEDAQSRYIEFLKFSVKNKNFSHLKIILDCANGSAYKIAPIVFKELGAKIIVLNNEPDGVNINENCGSQYPQKLQEIVLKEKADMGIAFDGDADRVVFIDEKGRIIDGDHILYFLACDFKKREKLKKNTIVISNYSNLALDEQLKKKKIKTIRTKNGDKYIIKKLIEEGYSLGGEKSGHLILGKYNSTGDGLMASLYIAKILKKGGKTLSELIQCVNLNPQIIYNVPVKEKKDFSHFPKFSLLKKQVEKELKDKGRLLIRYSGTENLCRIMIEGNSKERITELGECLAECLKRGQ